MPGHKLGCLLHTTLCAVTCLLPCHWPADGMCQNWPWQQQSNTVMAVSLGMPHTPAALTQGPSHPTCSRTPCLRTTCSQCQPVSGAPAGAAAPRPAGRPLSVQRCRQRRRTPAASQCSGPAHPSALQGLGPRLMTCLATGRRQGEARHGRSDASACSDDMDKVRRHLVQRLVCGRLPESGFDAP